MSEIKHTPWKAVRASHGPVDVFDSRDQDIVTVYGENNEQIARLIAAAPELLEALRETMFALSGAVAILYSGAELTEEFGEKVGEARRTFHAAIAKATGSQS